jgi:hypothetical protein
MDKRNVALLFFVFVLLAGQLLGQSGPPIFVSTYTGHQILSVDGTTTTVVYTGDNNFLPEDITVGPDNKLYVCDPTNGRILRMDRDGKNVDTVYNQVAALPPQNPGGAQGPQFDLAGTLFFNTKTTKNSVPSGVWRIDGLAAIPFGGPFPAPVNVLGTAQSGEGLALTSNGDLLIVNRSALIGGGVVQRSPGPLFASAKTIILNLYDPIGVAVNSVGDIFVSRGSLPVNNQFPENSPYAIHRFTLTSDNTVSSQTTYADFSDTKDQPNYLQFAFDDTLLVATSDATLQNGKLWKVTPPVPPARESSKTLLVDLAKLSINQPAVAMGVDLPRSITETFTGTKVYNFWSNAFEVTAGACTATITLRQRPPAEVNKILLDSGIKGTVQLLRGEGWATTWLVEPDPVAGCKPVLPPPNDYYGVAILGFVTDPFKISPGIVKCTDSPPGTDLPPVCKQQQDFGYFPEATTFLGPGDPISTTRPKSFSEYLFVNLDLVQNGNFYGPLSPLRSDPNNPAVFDIGRTIPVKFRLTDGNGSSITNAKAVLSVALIEFGGKETFIRRDISPAGKANAPPLFRYDKNLKQYLFNLQNSKSTGWKPGKYAGYITSDSFFPQKILFELR